MVQKQIHLSFGSPQKEFGYVCPKPQEPNISLCVYFKHLSIKYIVTSLDVLELLAFAFNSSIESKFFEMVLH